MPDPRSELARLLEITPPMRTPCIQDLHARAVINAALAHIDIQDSAKAEARADVERLAALDRLLSIYEPGVELYDNYLGRVGVTICAGVEILGSGKTLCDALDKVAREFAESDSRLANINATRPVNIPSRGDRNG